MLPDDLAVARGRARRPPDFHARFSARSRSYRYRIWRRRERSPFELHRSLWHPRPLDLERLNAAAALLARRARLPRVHARPTRSTTVFVRVVESARWHDRGDAVELEITADSFLRHMVRTLVGTMLEREPAELGELLEGRAALGGRLDRAAAGACTSTQRPY